MRRDIMDQISNVNDSKLYSLYYVSHFIARSFLIAILFFLTCFVLLFTVYFGDLLLNISTGKSKTPLFGAYIIVSPSMVPTIKINDAIIIKRLDHDRYKVGDIITFTSSNSNLQGMKITHRIVHKENENTDFSLYTTKGDANEVEDPGTITSDAIYGKVLFKVPKLGYIQDFFSKPSNYFKCLFIVAGLFVFYELGRIGVMMYTKKSF